MGRGLVIGSYNSVEILIKRGKAFYSYALEAIDRGDYDLVLFFLEQAAQLRLKALLLRLLGFAPKEYVLESFWEF